MNTIALFIPCFNEEKRLKISEFQSFIEENKEVIDFYFVDDGSSDLTIELLHNNLINNKNSFLVKIDQNIGKGNALRKAILEIYPSPYSYFGFIDADLEIPLIQILKLHKNIKESNCLMAISCRNLTDNISLKRIRSLSSVVILFVANKIIKFSVDLKDTQCGCKLFKREIVESCFKNEFISEWLFDIEIFLRYKTYNYSREKICEVPIFEMAKTGKSNLKHIQNLRIIQQLFLINGHYN